MILAGSDGTEPLAQPRGRGRELLEQLRPLHRVHARHDFGPDLREIAAIESGGFPNLVVDVGERRGNPFDDGGEEPVQLEEVDLAPEPRLPRHPGTGGEIPLYRQILLGKMIATAAIEAGENRLVMRVWKPQRLAACTGIERVMQRVPIAGERAFFLFDVLSDGFMVPAQRACFVVGQLAVAPTEPGMLLDDSDVHGGTAP